jgi:hypothetical protein
MGITKFKVIVAFDSYRVGMVIEPVGLWRGELLARKWIEPLVEAVKTPLKKHVERRNKLVADAATELRAQESAMG